MDLYKGFMDTLNMFLRVETILDMESRKRITGCFEVECPACSPIKNYEGPIYKVSNLNFIFKV